MIQGSIVPNITIFTADGALDREKTQWHMRWMFQHGVDGLFLTGSYGAGPLMSVEERVEVFRLARKVADEFSGKFLLPHVGCIDTESSVRLAREAEKIGVVAVGAVPPFYYKHADDVIIQYYKAIIDAVKIPVYAYNNPETSRYTFTYKTLQQLQKLGLAGLKDSPLNVGFITRVAYDAQVNNRDFQVIIGTSTGWLPFYYMGVRACIAGMNNWAPEIMTALVKWTFEGNETMAKKAYLVMMDVSAKLHFTDSTIASHMALYARGFDAGYPRKPMLLPPFSDPKYREIRNDVRAAFETLGLEFTTGTYNVIDA